MLQTLNIRTINNLFISLPVDSENTVRTVKDQIDVVLQAQKLLIFHGKILDDETTLSQCNIKNNDILDLSYSCCGGMQIFVKTFSGKTVGIEVDSNFTVQELKRKIHNELGYPPEAQRLMFGTKELVNNYTLAEYKIPADAAIYIVGRVLGGDT